MIDTLEIARVNLGGSDVFYKFRILFGACIVPSTPGKLWGDASQICYCITI